MWTPTQLEIELLTKMNAAVERGLDFQNDFAQRFIPSIYSQVAAWRDEREYYDEAESRLTNKQRHAFWRIVSKYQLGAIPAFSEHADAIRTVCGVMDALDEVHKTDWIDAEVLSYKRTITETMKRLATLRAKRVEDLDWPVVEDCMPLDIEEDDFPPFPDLTDDLWTPEPEPELEPELKKTRTAGATKAKGKAKKGKSAPTNARATRSRRGGRAAGKR